MSFQCASCGTTFKKKSNLNDHTKNIHGPQIRRKCTACSKEYKQMNNFLVHYKKEHSQKCRNKKCDSKKLCRGCANKLDKEKYKWRTQTVLDSSEKNKASLKEWDNLNSLYAIENLNAH